MSKIGVVFGFSERCTALAEQFLLTFSRNVVSNIKKDVKVDVWAYKCNFELKRPEEFDPMDQRQRIKNSEYQPFVNDVDLEHLEIDNFNLFFDDCSSDEFGRKDYHLPDIAIYQDFVDKRIDDYDYLMFCHDDIAFYNSTDMIDNMIDILDNPKYNLITKVSFNCNEDISIRFHPAMIFVQSNFFKMANLSFVNKLEILNYEDFRVHADGGAKLLNSYYSNNNTQEGKPYINVPEEWYTHLRGFGDTGVEFAYLTAKRSRKHFNECISQVEEYVDKLLYA